MKAIDTNVLIRLIVKDDEKQLVRALAVSASGVLVSLTVAMETEWVLRSRYKLGRDYIAQILLSFLNNNNFHFSREAGLRWAIERYRKGADFADMIHLVDAYDADGFATFDEGLASDAGSAAPLSITAF